MENILHAFSLDKTGPQGPCDRIYDINEQILSKMIGVFAMEDRTVYESLWNPVGEAEWFFVSPL